MNLKLLDNPGNFEKITWESSQESSQSAPAQTCIECVQLLRKKRSTHIWHDHELEIELYMQNNTAHVLGKKKHKYFSHPIYGCLYKCEKDNCKFRSACINKNSVQAVIYDHINAVHSDNSGKITCGWKGCDILCEDHASLWDHRASWHSSICIVMIQANGEKREKYQYMCENNIWLGLCSTCDKHISVCSSRDSLCTAILKHAKKCVENNSSKEN